MSGESAHWALVVFPGLGILVRGDSGIFRVIKTSAVEGLLLQTLYPKKLHRAARWRSVCGAWTSSWVSCLESAGPQNREPPVQD